MPAWTPAERRGALLVALLLALGAARDLWHATHPRLGAAPVAAGPSAAGDAGAPAAPTAASPARVDLNRASPAELDALPGIGPVLAGRIVRHRSEHGPFRDPEDLLAVPGIGPRLLERLRPRVRAGAPDSGESAPPAGRAGVAIGNPRPARGVQFPLQPTRGGGR